MTRTLDEKIEKKSEVQLPENVMLIVFPIKHTEHDWLLACLVTVCVCVFVHAVSSGSVTVNADSSVQLLAEEAVPLDQLDIAVSIMSTSLHWHTHWGASALILGSVALRTGRESRFVRCIL